MKSQTWPAGAYLVYERRARSSFRSLLLGSVVLCASFAPAAQDDWNGYLRGPRHASFNPGATAFTPSSATKLQVDWTFTAAPPTDPGQPDTEFNASPTVSGGVVYIGANTGVFYVIDESTGKALWHRALGYTTEKTCMGRGVTSTAAVAPDSSRNGQLTVYVGGGDGYLYALRSSDGGIVWRTRVVDVGANENRGYIWGSPTVVNGHVYVGISSQCDHPLIRGGIRDFDQASGALLHTYWTVPRGSIGGSVWTSPAADGTSVWATTGNADETSTEQVGDCFAIVRLDATSFNRVDRWIVTPSLTGTDLDWGSSPALFNATINGTSTRMVGAANKNGKFYAFNANDLASGPIWRRKLGAPAGDFRTKGSLIAAAIWDFNNKRLFVASNYTHIGGVAAAGSVRQLNASTGANVWETPLSAGPVMGTPTLSGGGIIAAGTYDNVTATGNRVYLLNASNGAIVNTIQEDASVFSQPVFADTHLFIATTSGQLTAYSTAR